MIETLFTLKYDLVPRTLHILRKGMFRKDTFMRQIKDRKDWLGKALWGCGEKVRWALKDEQKTKKPNPNWLQQ